MLHFIATFRSRGVEGGKKSFLMRIYGIDRAR